MYFSERECAAFLSHLPVLHISSAGIVKLQNPKGKVAIR